METEKKCTIYVATGLHDSRCNLADISYIRRYLPNENKKYPS
jgi:hypothetical protein